MRIQLVVLISVLIVGSLPPALAQGGTTTPPPGMTPEMRQRMMAFVQDLLIMTQNTAITTPDGVIVLQGNRLLQYANDLTLRRTVPLPLPPAPTVTPGTTPGAVTERPLRSMIPARLFVQGTGEIIVVRGQQIVRLSRDLRVLNTGSIPDLPPLTPAEVAVVVPLASQMAMMMNMHGGMMPGGMAAGMPGGMPATGGR